MGSEAVNGGLERKHMIVDLLHWKSLENIVEMKNYRFSKVRVKASKVILLTSCTLKILKNGFGIWHYSKN